LKSHIIQPFYLAYLPIFLGVGLILALMMPALIWFVDRAAKRRERYLRETLEEMRKQFKLRGDEISKEILGAVGFHKESAMIVEECQSRLLAFDARLRELVSSLTEVSSKVPEIAQLEGKIDQAKDMLTTGTRELAIVAKKAKELEEDHNEAVRRIVELESATLTLQQQRGIAAVAPNRASVYEATQRAIELAWQNGATSEAQLAKKMASEEGATILRAMDASSQNDAEGASAIIDGSTFDPYSLHQNLWEGAIAAKHTLELARRAAILAMAPFGFSLDKPRVGIDFYEKERHDLRDSLTTDREELKGKIAEVRRPGFLQENRVVRPARVVQYAIDYAKVSDSSGAESQVVEAAVKPVQEAPSEPGERKRGLAEF
jgi:hypothetical protein